MARPTAAAPAAAATAAAPAAAATAPAAPAPAEPTAAVPLNAKAVKVALTRAVAYLRRVRPRVSLLEIQVEMGLPKTSRVLGRFLGGVVEHPDQQNLAVFAEWARQHAAPPPQTQVCDGLSPPTMARLLLIPLLFSPCPLPLQAYGLRPADYGINLRIAAGSHLCGVQPTRLAALTQLLQLGELNPNLGVLLRPHLQQVLEAMDQQDSEFAVQMCILSADVSACFDAFHSQNRNAQSGMGNFCSRELGFVLLLEVLDKDRTEGVAGISQRLEKEGLKRGLYRLIVELGLPVTDLCTDQSSGGPRDIGLVLAKPEVQKLLTHLPAAMRGWAAREMGGAPPAAAADPDEPLLPPTPGSGRHAGRWAGVVDELSRSMASMAAVDPEDVATIVHHYDGYHVEVKVVSEFKSRVESGTKTAILPKETAVGPAPLAAAAAGADDDGEAAAADDDDAEVAAEDAALRLAKDSDLERRRSIVRTDNQNRLEARRVLLGPELAALDMIRWLSRLGLGGGKRVVSMRL